MVYLPIYSPLTAKMKDELLAREIITVLEDTKALIG